MGLSLTTDEDRKEEDAIPHSRWSASPVRRVGAISLFLLGSALVIGAGRGLLLKSHLGPPQFPADVTLGPFIDDAQNVLREPQASSGELRRFADRAEGLALLGKEEGALCLAWLLRVEALRRDPNDSTLLLEIAHRARGDTFDECDASGITPAAVRAQIEQIATHALESSPYHLTTLRGAGMLLLEEQHRAKAFDALSRYLLYSTSVSATYEQRLLDVVRDNKELTALVPMRFPQIVRWSKLIHASERGELLDALGQLQRGAVVNSAEELARGELALHTHGQRLFELNALAANDEVRRVIDGELSRYFLLVGNGSAHQLFAAREKLRRIPVPVAVMPNDTRVSKTALVGWGGAPAAFDFYFTSIGFYVPESRHPRFVTMQSAARARVDKELYRLLKSTDSQIWEEVEISNFQQIDIHNATFVVISPVKWDAPFWKLHYKSPQRNATFRNSVSELVQVYGG